MTAGAAHWLETLTVADKQTWDAFKAKFCSRYLQPEYVHFRAAKLLFNTKQQPSESADDFFGENPTAGKTDQRRRTNHPFCSVERPYAPHRQLCDSKATENNARIV